MRWCPSYDTYSSNGNTANTLSRMAEIKTPGIDDKTFLDVDVEVTGPLAPDYAGVDGDYRYTRQEGWCSTLYCACR